MTKLPPEPEFRDGKWWYKDGRYYKTEAFREYNDDRAAYEHAVASVAEADIRRIVREELERAREKP